MNSAILSLSTAVPCYHFLQADLSQKFMELFDYPPETRDYIKKIYINSAIDKRYSVLEDFHYAPKERKFWGDQYPKVVPGMTKRNTRYKEEAPKLAEEAARLALHRWGGTPGDITHIISASCTGLMAPGIEYHLMENLGLPATVNRLGINFMGCFGAFKGLSVARAFTQENPQARVLLVCTELCSLHMQADPNHETIMGNCIFADGAAAAIIGSQPLKTECPLWEITNIHSMGLKNTLDKMSWEAGDHGLFLRLSHTIPVHIGRHIQLFVQDLLQNKVPVPDCDFAIHPGGKSILQVIEKILSLQKDQTLCSWDTLANYGNMSSATYLFVLDELTKKNSERIWSVGLGFGPGLSAEGILLRRANK